MRGPPGERRDGPPVEPAGDLEVVHGRHDQGDAGDRVRRGTRTTGRCAPEAVADQHRSQARWPAIQPTDRVEVVDERLVEPEHLLALAPALRHAVVAEAHAVEPRAASRRARRTWVRRGPDDGRQPPPRRRTAASPVAGAVGRVTTASRSPGGAATKTGCSSAAVASGAAPRPSRQSRRAASRPWCPGVAATGARRSWTNHHVSSDGQHLGGHREPQRGPARRRGRGTRPAAPPAGRAARSSTGRGRVAHQRRQVAVAGRLEQRTGRRGRRADR